MPLSPPRPHSPQKRNYPRFTSNHPMPFLLPLLILCYFPLLLHERLLFSLSTAAELAFRTFHSEPLTINSTVPLSLHSTAPPSLPLSSPVPSLTKSAWVGGTQPLPHTSAQCLPYLFYDAPPHTSPSSYLSATKRYLRSHGVVGGQCPHPYCRKRVREACADIRQPAHIFGPTPGQQDLLECLRPRGYYLVTSIRAPHLRWRLRFVYDVMKWQPGQPFEPSTRAFASFMSRIPACELFNYYDGEGVDCGDKASVDDRIERIVRRYDEVLEMDERSGGIDLEQRLEKYVRVKARELPKVNVSIVTHDDSRLDNEKKLYQGLRRLRKRRQYAGRVLCGVS